jgi:hypothetical protein
VLEFSILSFNAFIISASFFELTEQEAKTITERSTKAMLLKVVCGGNIKAGFPINAENQLFL